MVLPGIPYKSEPRETSAHYRVVARAGGQPVMIDNNPVGYGVDIPPAMLADMGDEPLFTAIKESFDDIRRIREITSLCGDRFSVLTGVDTLALRPSIPDSLPVIGMSKRSPQVLYAFGHGHYGMTQFHATADVVAALVAGRPPGIDIAPFSPRRF